MRKKTIISISAFVLVVALSVALIAHVMLNKPDAKAKAANFGVGNIGGSDLIGGKYKVFIASDLHYFPKDLYDDSETFRSFESSGDGKMISYSETICKAFINDILTEKPAAVILSGDLTLNGEKVGHESLSSILSEVTEAGIRVFVIPGNHDINNPYARSILNNRFQHADYVTPDQFTKIYKQCGYNYESEPESAITYDEYSLSYISRLSGSLYGVFIDTSRYESNIDNNTSSVGGGIYQETMDWISDTAEGIRAEDTDAVFITVMHHNLLEHNRNFNFNYVLYFSDKLQTAFSELGFNLFFSGHIHIQDILTKSVGDYNVTEIVNSALVTYPISYGVMEFDKDGMSYYTQPVNMKRYALDKNIDDPNLLDFESYSKMVFSERSGRRVSEALTEFGYLEEDIKLAQDTLRDINAHYFAGRIDELRDKVLDSKGYALLKENGISTGYIDSVFEQGSGENNKIRIDWK